MKKKKVLKIIIIVFVLLLIIAGGIYFAWYRLSKIDRNATKAYNNMMKMFSNEEYYIEYKISSDYVSENIKVAQKDKKVFIQESQDGNEILNLIYIDPLTISLNNANKTYSITEGRTEDVDSLLDLFFSFGQSGNIYTTEYEKGTETIDGIKYNYESFDDGEGKTVYYFIKDELKFFKYVGSEGEELKTEILSYSSTVDDNIFIVPEDYTEDKSQDDTALQDDTTLQDDATSQDDTTLQDDTASQDDNTLQDNAIPQDDTALQNDI